MLLNLWNYSVRRFCRRLEREEKTEGTSRIPRGNGSVQRFGRVLWTNRGVRACERAETLGKTSASPLCSVRNKKLGELFQ